MNKLVIFGDSNSLPFFGNPIESEKYRVYKGGTLPKGWMEILSDTLNLELSSFATMGYSNAEIFQSFCNNCHLINENDLVLIGWTFKMRFQVITENEIKEGDEPSFGFSNVLPNYLPQNSLLDRNSMNKFLIHKNHPYWVNEIYSWEKIIIEYSKVKEFKIMFWSFDEHIGKSYINNSNHEYYLGKKDLKDYYKSESYKKLNTNINYDLEFEKYGFWKHLEMLGMKQIWDETNGLVNDGHIDEMGHKILGDLFLYQLKNYGILG